MSPMSPKLKAFLSGLKKFAPMILGRAFPKLRPLVTIIEKGIADAEKLAAAGGAEKRNHVLELASDFVDGYNATAKGQKQPLKKALVLDTAGKAIDTTVSVINLGKDVKGQPLQ